MAGRAGCRRPSALISKTAAGAEQPGNQTNETMTTTIRRNQGPDRRLDGHPARGAGVLREGEASNTRMLGRLTREKRKQVAAELRALAEKALVLAALSALFDAMQESQPEEDEE